MAHNGPRAQPEGTAAPAIPGAETGGGAMVRAPESGDGTRSYGHDMLSAGLTPPRRRAGVLGRRAEPREAGSLADDSLAAAPGAGGSWNGAGGRWVLWPLRIVLWAALLMIAFRGITAIALGEAPRPTAGPGSASSAAGQFPVALAEAYAAEFGRAYLSLNQQTQAQRQQALAAFVPASLAAAHPDLGWNGTGQMNLQAEQVAGITVQDREHAVVTLLAMVNGQLMELGVPVAAGGGGVVVSGEPAWLPAPPQVSPPSPAPGGPDRAAQAQLMNILPAFFQAYASGDSAALAKFLAPGVSLTGLAGAVTFDSIAGLYVPAGGVVRHITATVSWDLPEQPESTAARVGLAPKLEMTYGVSVVELKPSEWYVKGIGAATETVGAR